MKHEKNSKNFFVHKNSKRIFSTQNSKNFVVPKKSPYDSHKNQRFLGHKKSKAFFSVLGNKKAMLKIGIMILLVGLFLIIVVNQSIKEAKNEKKGD